MMNAISRQQADFQDAHLTKIVIDEYHSNTVIYPQLRDKLRHRRDFVGWKRGFRPRAPNRVCCNCCRKGHLHYYCNDKPDPRVPRQNDGRRCGNFDRQQSRFGGNNFGDDQAN